MKPHLVSLRAKNLELLEELRRRGAPDVILNGVAYGWLSRRQEEKTVPMEPSSGEMLLWQG
ncbi:MAG: hypothetical protein COT92_00830 [Candidatus Doudnabacteria bacterium CG10_big_fil_rev_8_21_14_0_10_42_18]|uniref:Uncharacterized protein n=1 Tax=Candidatus Doudnabacteria bacterium CG10_big_fil_rev_8_21_14_0_10_42_18 TaxID=1974552 RepID=A0A2H0VBN8_9BACT|nr:MAG: hypothetical protein COT92_00830 [Candidatus Doudnabacteria bacterium CG10_big_fil_rev_8_21_14_0_10_42_18]